MDMKKSSGMFTSATPVWATPQDTFDTLNEEFGGFTVDVCADANNHKCDKYFDEATDGLKQTWNGRVWMNPPYGRTIGLWMKKAYESVQNGDAELAVCLIPSRTDTAWWHDYCMKGEVRFIRGRLKFGGSKNCAPFPSAIVVFRKP